MAHGKGLRAVSTAHGLEALSTLGLWEEEGLCVFQDQRRTQEVWHPKHTHGPRHKTLDAISKNHKEFETNATKIKDTKAVLLLRN